MSTNMNMQESFSGGVDNESSTSSAYSNTIWSSVPSSSSHIPRQVPQSQLNISDFDTISDVMPPTEQSSTSSLTLTLNPAMIDTSILSINFRGDASNTNENSNAIQSEGTELDVLSFDSSLSFGSISTCSLASIPDHSPHLFTNIGRSPMQLSANENDSVDGRSVASCASSKNGTSCFDKKDLAFNYGDGAQWWSRFQTEEDWESFTEMAAQYLSFLLSAELVDMENKVDRDRDPWRMKEPPNSAVVPYGRQKDTYSIAKFWLKKLYEAVASSIMGADVRDPHTSYAAQMKMKYISSLVKELASVQQRLNALHPLPPALPDVTTLGDLPDDTRTLLIRHCSLFDAWRAETMEQRELLEAKHSVYREKILSAIIETEEDLFWPKDETKDEKLLGSYNDHGYFHVVECDSPYWDGVDDAYVLQRKCQTSFKYYAALAAAGVAGIAGFLLQSKKR